MADFAGKRLRVFPRTIQGLALTFAGLVVFVTTLLGVAAFAVVHHEIDRQIEQRIKEEAAALLEYEADHGFDALVTLITLRERRARIGAFGYLSGADGGQSRTIGYIVTDSSGKRVAGSLQAKMPPLGWSECLAIRRLDGTDSDARALNSALLEGGHLVVAGDRETVYKTDTLLIRLVAAAFGVIVLLGGLMVLIFGRIIRQRLNAMETSAQAIIAGDLSRRMPIEGGGVELDRVALLLNTLLDHIGTLAENVKAVSDGMAHDLRTPLSRLRARLEQSLLLSQDAGQRALLEHALRESDHLLDLFGSMLAIAEIDRRKIRVRFQNWDLGQAVTEIVDAHRPALEDAGMTLTVKAAEVVIHGERMLIQRLVSNLLDNILCHAKSATRVAVSVSQDADAAIIRIADDGAGIPEPDRERVFDRLVRLDPARSDPGHGLGLSMVRAIAAAHDGTVRLVDVPQGTMIELRLPLGQPALNLPSAG